MVSMKAISIETFLLVLIIGPWQGTGSMKSIPPESQREKIERFSLFFCIYKKNSYLCPK